MTHAEPSRRRSSSTVPSADWLSAATTTASLNVWSANAVRHVFSTWLSLCVTSVTTTLACNRGGVIPPPVWPRKPLLPGRSSDCLDARRPCRLEAVRAEHGPRARGHEWDLCRTSAIGADHLVH